MCHTFDDGYIDHYNNVLPILEENNIKGSFFITSNRKQICFGSKQNSIYFRKKCIFLIEQIKKYTRKLKTSQQWWIGLND